MFFAISKLTFESQATARDARDLSALVEKIRAKYKVSVEIIDEFHKGGDAGIIVAVLHKDEMKLSNTIDSIADACEDSGFGRIHSENTILEDFESFSEEHDED